mgnify:CR=1 FL=1
MDDNGSSSQDVDFSKLSIEDRISHKVCFFISFYHRFLDCLIYSVVFHLYRIGKQDFPVMKN